MSRELGTKADRNSFAGRLLTGLTPLVEGVSGKQINTFVKGPTKGGKGGGRAAQDSKARAAVEEFDAAEARKRVAARNAARQKTRSSDKNPTPKTKFPEPSNKELEPSNAGIVNKESRIQTTGAAQTQVFNINSFLTEVINNDVLPSHSYLVTFSPFRDGYDENTPLTKFVTNKRSNLIMRCESIILPTPSLLEEENIRRYGYGPVEKIPYGVQFSDVAMTWLVDSNSEIIDFMHQWMNTIVMHDSPGANMAQTSQKRDNLNNYRPFEVGYKDGYTNPIVRVYVYNRQLQTVTEYEMFDVFPMNIQSMNLAWSDENQLQKLTVNFAYTNMRVKAPRIVKNQGEYDNLEALLSPYEERRQPSDKGGAAAADAASSPIGESLQSTANASKPNATESKPIESTGAAANTNQPQTRFLGPPA
jgi:hypothetical protein